MFNVNLLGLRSLEAKPRGERLLEAALEYARSGAKVVPVYANSKIPGVEEWSVAATNDPAVIRRWFSKGGEFWDCNLALYIAGFKVIDVDRHGDVDGFKTLDGALDHVSCPMAVTAGDGAHYVTNRTDIKNDPKNGVEVLGEGKLFMVYPSEINGKRYVWKNGGMPTPAERIRENARAVQLPGAVALAPAPYVREILEYIDPDCDYGTWLKVGMAIHHNDAGPVGLKVWDEWSAQGRKYKEGECERRWNTFDANRGKPTTMRWLIVEAVKCGRRITKEDILYHGNLMNSMEVDRVNERFGIYDLGGKMYITYTERGNVHFADPANFRVKIADWKIEVEGKLRPMADVWLEHPDRRIITDVGMWEPGKEPEGALNYYTGLAVAPVECVDSDVGFFLDFCLNDICRGNQVYYEYLMDLLALKLQKPLELTKIALVMRGGEGAGKGALTRVMEAIIGTKHSVRVSSSNSWLGTYGTMLKSAIWLSANEAYWSGNHQQGERLKALVSEDEIDIEEKFINIKKYRNRIMVAITTNNQWAVPAGHDSRRYFVLDVSDNRRGDATFWDEFHRRYGVDEVTGIPHNPVELGKLLYWFLKRKITHSMKHAMETEWLIKQRKMTAQDTPEEMFIFWLRASFTGDLPDDIITGAGSQTFIVLERLDGSACIRSDKIYEDYRTYVNKNTRKPRMLLDIGSFYDCLRKVGMPNARVQKERLKINGKPLPGTMGNGSKISVMNLASPDDIEAHITKEFPLFAQED